MKLTEGFSEISLKEMERVQLMNRKDYKYWFHIRDLYQILEDVKDDYFVLSIEGESLMPYETMYYDTSKNHLFLNHHNGRLNRSKIRKRTYVNSDLSFLEVKHKNNKGKTLKKRISIPKMDHGISPKENKFLESQTVLDINDLRISLSNEFNRITLVSKEFTERCTIDIKLSFKAEDTDLELSNLVIIEIKTEGNTKQSPLAIALRNRKIGPSGFSKYCIGMSLTHDQLKKNAFKPKIRRIEQVLQTNYTRK